MEGGTQDDEQLTTDIRSRDRLMGSADGAAIYFLSNRNPWVLSLQDHSERQLTDLEGRQGYMYFFPGEGAEYAPDGRFLYFSWREDVGDIWVMDVVQDNGSDD